MSPAVFAAWQPPPRTPCSGGITNLEGTKGVRRNGGRKSQYPAIINIILLI